MKKFIFNIFGFVGLLVSPFIVLFVLALVIPPTPKALLTSPLFSQPQKDFLLKNTEAPRIIFIGGSNVAYGLDSQAIKDALDINPINTAIIRPLGLKYMLENAYQYIKEGDIIVVMLEYQNFYLTYDYVSDALAMMILDVDKSKIKLLNLGQMPGFFQQIPKLAFSKLNPINYIVRKGYSPRMFNEYGDNYYHWTLGRHDFNPSGPLDVKKYDPKAMEGLKQFEEKLHQKCATLYVSYPSYQDIAFDYSVEAINKVEEEYIKHGFAILGTPRRYRMDDSLMFDSSYHLLKRGVDLRTQLLIEDLKKADVGR